jgi:membrane-associated phospholipid phosphatase
MKQRFLSAGIVVLLQILLANAVLAQIDTIGFNKYYIRKCFSDSKAIATAPFHWNQKDWAKFGIITSSVAVTMLADQSVADFSQENRSRRLDRFSANFLEPFDAEYSFLTMGAFLTHGLLAKSKKSVSTGLLLFESYSLAMVFVRIPKNLLGRKRPDAWPPSTPTDWDGPFKGAAFPSGHTTAAFAVASVVANQYRNHKWVPVTAYTVASLAGLSRIYENRHWLSDVVAGAAIGTVIGNLVSHRTTNSKLTVVPFGNGNFQGVKLAYNL